jgi:hypothetical protein
VPELRCFRTQAILLPACAAAWLLFVAAFWILLPNGRSISIVRPEPEAMTADIRNQSRTELIICCISSLDVGRLDHLQASPEPFGIFLVRHGHRIRLALEVVQARQHRPGWTARDWDVFLCRGLSICAVACILFLRCSRRIRIWGANVDYCSIASECGNRKVAMAGESSRKAPSFALALPANHLVGCRAQQGVVDCSVCGRLRSRVHVRDLFYSTARRPSSIGRPGFSGSDSPGTIGTLQIQDHSFSPSRVPLYLTSMVACLIVLKKGRLTKPAICKPRRLVQRRNTKLIYNMTMPLRASPEP